MDAIKQGLGPIAHSDARLFILGSLPGERSLTQQRYYAHPTNQFWRLVGTAIGEELGSLDYRVRLNRLAARRIGLWDVVASARRRGSLDGAIRDARHNALADLVRDHRDLRAIAFNGAMAATAGRRALGDLGSAIALIDLPSSSAANTMPFDEKAAAWAAIAEHLD